MSKLHSVYAWGVVGMIIVSSIYLYFVGSESWYWLTLAFTAVPLFSAFLFLKAELPTLETPEKMSGVLSYLKNKTLWLCVAAIFLGGAAECTMAQWCSGYLEKALGVDKIWGDLFGTALFAMMLGLGRTMYSKFGKNVSRVLFLGAVGATVCYFTAAFSSIEVIGLLACALTGFCVSMLWPGSLIISSDKFPHGGVFIYAMMASGGDFGAAIAPQLVGNIADLVGESAFAVDAASTLGITAEQLGMKCGILVGMLFSLAAVFVYLYIWRTSKRHTQVSNLK